MNTPKYKTQLQITTTPEDTQKFIKELFSRISVCFVSGAFVFSDNTGDLSKFLLGTKHVVRTWASSHLSLKTKGDKKTLTEVDKKNLKILYEIDYGKILYTIKCKKTDIKITNYDKYKCMLIGKDEIADAERDIRIIKWYPFNGKYNKQYIYFKLEDYPTFAFGHLTQVISTYVLGNPNKSDCKSFREDCKKQKKPKKSTNKKR